ncbi:MAG TPA: sigma-70 family RNA polymerase sigma factor [Anaerovoracaceae bacterium]|nr:sigma-70 family RNA polymerase sigma factor [Anaerovoracaceae bacterium]
MDVGQHYMTQALSENQFFRQLEEKEFKLYSHILSFSPLRKINLEYLFECAKDSKETIVVEKDFDKEQFRLMDAPKKWSREIHKLLTQSEDVLSNSIPFGMVEGYYKCSSEQFDAWKNTILVMYPDIVECKNNFGAANLGLVGAFVKKLKLDLSLNVASEDLIQEGYFGLMRAIEKFDYTKNLKFSTYSAWWVRHFIQRYIYDKNSFIRMPSHTADIRTKIDSFKLNFAKINGREPSQQEIVKGTGLSKLTLNTIAEPVKVICNDIEADYGWLEDNKTPSPLDTLIEIETKTKLHEAFKQLTFIEQNVLYQRFNEDKSLSEVAREIDLSREGIRQIQLKALEKVRDFLNQE